jgi:predicted 2-oxoglutarate/Fe(II)-dependent dioxygenase YbiX
MERLEGKSWFCGYQCEIPTCDHQPTDLIFLLGKIASPFCVKGVLKACYIKQNPELFKSSTLGALNIPEMLAECQESAFGRGAETVFDPSIRKSHEILASQLNKKTVNLLASELRYQTYALARHLKLQLRPYKLVIYQEGGHFDAHRDTVRGDGHIGTLVLILNSEYTGGELEITHNGHTEVVTGPYSWVAMYGDCLHKINPLTSGTRVSLIFDIYATHAEIDDNAFWSTGGQGTRKEFGVTDNNCAAILAGIENELLKHDTLIICLSHKYPFCQAVPEFLKGGDLALYELLKDAYDTEVVACEVNCEVNGEETTEMCARLFTSFSAGKETHAPPTKVAKRQSTKFLIPAPIDPAGVLEYSPYLDHAGNEPQPSKSVYLVSGLQLRRRV